MSANRRERTYIGFTDPTVATVWTEVTDYVLQWGWKFGREAETEVFRPGTGQLTLANGDHRFNPLLTSGPYGSSLVPMRRFKIEGWWNLLTANQASVETDTTGWAAGANTTITRSTTLAQDGVASLRLSSTAAGNVSATTPTGASGVAVTKGEPIVGMASFRAGASARSCRVDLGWYDQNGSLVSTTTGATVTSATGSWTQATTTAVAPATGYVAVIVVVQSTAAGSELHYVDQVGLFPADAGTPAWSAGGPYPVASGFVPSWEPLYDDVAGGTVTIPIIDGLAALVLAELPESTWSYEVGVDSPSAWWRFGDAAGATVAWDSSGNTRHGAYTSLRLPADSLVPASSDGALTLSPTVAASPAATVPAFSGTAWSAELWFKVPLGTLGNSSNWWIVDADGLSSAGALYVDYTTGTPPGFVDTLRVSVNDGAGGVVTYTLAQARSLFQGNTYHVVITKSGTTATIYVNGTSVASGAVSAVVTAWGTRHDLLKQNDTGSPAFTLDELVFYPSALSAARVTAHYNAGYGWPGDDTGTRMGRALDAVGWSATDRVIGTGSSILQPAAWAGQNCYSHLEQLNRTEQGRLYMDQQGRLVFTSRWSTITGSKTSLATFGDAAGERHYAAIRPASDIARIVNRVVAQRVGGNLVERQNLTSQGRYLKRTDPAASTDLLFLTDAEVVDYADWRLNRYAAAAVRLKGLELDPVGVADLWDQVYGRGIGDRITVKNRLPDGPVILDRAYLIEGVSHSRAGRRHRTIWYLSDVDTTNYFVLDDSTYGVLDTSALAF